MWYHTIKGMQMTTNPLHTTAITTTDYAGQDADAPGFQIRLSLENNPGHAEFTGMSLKNSGLITAQLRNTAGCDTCYVTLGHDIICEISNQSVNVLD
jgi:hypothetical protein